MNKGAQELKSYKKIIGVLLIAGGLLIILAAVFSTQKYYRSVSPEIRTHINRNPATIQAWMTTHYIARSYGVPEGLLFNSLGITPQEAAHQNLQHISQLKKEDVSKLLIKLEATVSAYQSQHPSPAP